MAPVTIASGDRSSYYSTGNIGWTARSAFSYHAIAEALAAPGTNTVWGRSATPTRIAQSFVTPATGGKISAIRAVVSIVGTPTDTMFLNLHTNNVDRPSATILGVSETVGPAKLSSTSVWYEFKFATPIEVTASTKYWFSVERSGALDNANYFRNDVASSIYAAGGSSAENSGVWTAEHATNDMLFQALYEAPNALYHVTQDSSLHVWRSTDYGATWTEQDAANAPTVFNAALAFDANNTINGPFIITARFTAASTVAVRLFNMQTNTWAAGDYGTTPPSAVVSSRNIRVTSANLPNASAASPGPIYLHYTDTADTADLAYSRVTLVGSAWGSKTSVLALSSAEASMYADVIVDRTSPGHIHRFYYDTLNDDFAFRSISTTTQSTEIDIDDTAATTDAKYAAAVIQTFTNGSGTTSATVPYINSNDTLNARYMEFDTTSALAYMSGGFVMSTDTGAAGRSVSTCRYDGTDYTVFSNSATSIAYTTSTTLGTWTTDVAWKTGLTAATLTQALAIPSIGVLVFYTENNVAKADWLVGPFINVSLSDSGTVSITEAASLDATVPVSDSATLSVTDTMALAATLTRTDTGTVSVSELLTAIVTSAVTLTDSDTLTVSETFAPSSTIALVDAPTITVTETTSLAVTLPLADTGSISVTDVLASTSTIPLADSDTLTGAETFAAPSAIALTDTDALTVSETFVVSAVSMSLTDSDTLSGAETFSPSSTLSLVDSAPLTGSEAAQINVSVAVVDTGTLTGTESNSLTATSAVSDSGTVSVVDAISVFLSDSIVPVSLADSGSLSITESMQRAASFTASDTDTITVIDAIASIAVTVSLNDSGSLTGVETASLVSAAVFTDSDALTATESLTGHVLKSLADSGTIAVTDVFFISDELETTALTDVGTVAVTELLSISTTLSFADTGLVSGTITDLLLSATLTWNDLDTLTGTETFFKRDPIIFDRIAGMSQTSPPQETPILGILGSEITLFLARQGHTHAYDLSYLTSTLPLVLSSATTDTTLSLSTIAPIDTVLLARESEDIV